MSIRQLLISAGIILAMCAGCVDPDFNMDNIKVEGVVFKNMEVPIGNFEELTLKTILEAQGASVVPLASGTYQLSGSAEITGISLKFSEQMYFKKAELHTVIINTLPLDMDFSVTAINAEGLPCEDATVSIESSQKPMLASGTKSKPSSNPVVLKISCKDKYTTLDGLHLVFSGRTGAGFEGEAPAMDEGITLTQVVLKMPEGFTMNM